jgi:hypothetical protein
MRSAFQWLVVVVLALAVVGGGGYYFYKSYVAKPDHLSKFNVTTERMVKDLDGKSVMLPFGQAWPFEKDQGVSVQVVSKKQVDDYVVVAVEVSAVAKVEPPPKDEKSKEPPPKLPSKVSLSGIMKMTYEEINGQWYLIGLESVSLQAKPLD